MKRLVLAGGLCSALAAAIWALSAALTPPDGPAPLAWDREACAHCRMHVGDRRFAAQLQTTDGRVLNFDDPGCLFKYAAEHRPSERARYFRHLTEDRWVPGAAASFVPAEGSPMGYGLGAIDRRAGAMTSTAASAQVLDGREGDQVHAP